MRRIFIITLFVLQYVLCAGAEPPLESFDQTFNEKIKSIDAQLKEDDLTIEDWNALSFGFEKPDKSYVYPAAYMFSSFAITMAIAFSLFTLEEMKWETFGVKTFWSNISTMDSRWDQDRWFFNMIGHPLLGSEAYLRARMHNFSIMESFMFSFIASTFWEYAVEGWVEPVSIQDMIITPTAGTILGEMRFRTKLFCRKQGGFFGKAGTFLIDPFQSIIDSVYWLVVPSARGAQAPVRISVFYLYHGTAIPLL